MNIFVLDSDPQKAAMMHCDPHVRKMIIEYLQIASTAKRVIDGEAIRIKVNNRARTIYALENELVEIVETSGVEKVEISPFNCYLATHVNHPSSIWARQSSGNYLWLMELTKHLLVEYTFRHGKIHACTRAFDKLRDSPTGIPSGPITPFAQAMPDEFKVENDAISAYRNFYVGSKSRFAVWSKRESPDWFSSRVDKPKSAYQR